MTEVLKSDERSWRPSSSLSISSARLKKAEFDVQQFSDITHDFHDGNKCNQNDERQPRSMTEVKSDERICKSTREAWHRCRLRMKWKRGILATFNTPDLGNDDASSRELGQDTRLNGESLIGADEW